jgi:hypothetical protein
MDVDKFWFCCWWRIKHSWWRNICCWRWISWQFCMKFIIYGSNLLSFCCYLKFFELIIAIYFGILLKKCCWSLWETAYVDNENDKEFDDDTNANKYANENDEDVFWKWCL